MARTVSSVKPGGIGENCSEALVTSFESRKHRIRVDKLTDKNAGGLGVRKVVGGTVGEEFVNEGRNNHIVSELVGLEDAKDRGKRMRGAILRLQNMIALEGAIFG